MSRKSPTYVGKLVGIVDSSGNEIPVMPRALGVDPSRGLSTAATRADLLSGKLDARPSTGETLDVASVLYDRRREGYPGAHWIHETPGATATLDKQNPPFVYLDAPDETRCDMEGDFLCSDPDDRSSHVARSSRRSSSRRSAKSNPPRKRARTSGTKKGQRRKTARRAYEGLKKGRRRNPPILQNPMVQGAIGGAAGFGITAAVDNFMKTQPANTRDMTKIAAIAAAGALLSSNMVAKGSYKDAGAAMIGVATYEAVDYARKMASAATTSGLVYDPLGVPTVSGLVYDPLGRSLNPNSSVSQYA